MSKNKRDNHLITGASVIDEGFVVQGYSFNTGEKTNTYKRFQWVVIINSEGLILQSIFLANPDGLQAFIYNELANIKSNLGVS